MGSCNLRSLGSGSPQTLTSKFVTPHLQNFTALGPSWNKEGYRGAGADIIVLSGASPDWRLVKGLSGWLWSKSSSQDLENLFYQISIWWNSVPWMIGDYDWNWIILNFIFRNRLLLYFLFYLRRSFLGKLTFAWHNLLMPPSHWKDWAILKLLKSLILLS